MDKFASFDDKIETFLINIYHMCGKNHGELPNNNNNNLSNIHAYKGQFD